jgi:hypothetical protein
MIKGIKDQEFIDGLLSSVAERDVTILELKATIDSIKGIVNEFVPGISASGLLGRIKDIVDPASDDGDDDGRGEDLSEQDWMTSDFW